jgi:3-hydroxyisobutyrate dehydrogenase-like beta-hydroxyacid dehydrogenase
MGEAERLGAELPAGRLVSDTFSEAMKAGLGEEDFVAIAKIAERLAGAKIEP